MRHTPWTKPQQSSFPSDRIRPSYATSQQSSGKGKGKGKSQPQGPPRSKEALALEALVNKLEKQDGGKIEKDPKGGCFCLAREHALSPYSPLCMTCGLILCNLNLPTFACPHCSSPLLTTPGAYETVLTKLRSQIADIERKEREAREEARRAAGAFPALGPSPVPSLPPSAAPSPSPSPKPPDNRVHKVVSLGSGNKKTTITSYAPKKPKPPATTPTEDEGEKLVRVPPPSAPDVPSATSLDPSRPWKNLLGNDVKYVPEKGK